MDYSQLWAGADVGFTVILAVTLLVMLYAMALMNRAIRLLQYQTSVIENDLKLMGEELKMIANRDQSAFEHLKPPASD